MTDSAMIIQLKALDDACRQLQRRVGEDNKSGQLLHNMRTLLTRLVLDETLGPALSSTAEGRFRALQPALEQLTGPSADQDLEPEILRRLHVAHRRLSALGTLEAGALCQELVNIEAEYIERFETTFRAELTTTATPQTADSVVQYDKRALTDFLKEKAFPGSDLTVTSIEVLAGGFSKLTLGVRLEGGSDVPPRLVLRCDLPVDQAVNPTTVKDEYVKLMVAYRHGVRVPRPYALDEVGGVIGMRFIALSHAAGRTVGTLFEFPPPDPELGRDIARQLARIHTLPASALGPEVMGPAIATIDRVRGEIDLSFAIWKDLAQPSCIIDEGFRRLYRDIALADGTRALVHGDIGLHNMMVENSRITAMLDWEYAKIGNPADDLGYFYFTADHLLGWDAFLEEYVAAGGVAPPREQIDFYSLLGLIRVCVLCYRSHGLFLSGNCPQIEYSIPYNLLLRGTALRAARLLNTSRAG